jgi:hypothetical protein
MQGGGDRGFKGLSFPQVSFFLPIFFLKKFFLKVDILVKKGSKNSFFEKKFFLKGKKKF